ncbi:MAG: hypothetical protein AAGA44_17185 [Pseudomonadota bacterium]
MEPNDANFLSALFFYLMVATILLYRRPTDGMGFPMFLLVYPFFLIGFWYASITIVMVAWLALAVLNMPFQLNQLRRENAASGATGAIFASLFLWPIQFAAAVNNAESEKAANKRKNSAREKLGPLPAEATGKVSFTHYLDIDDGYDAIWLEEFDELEFMTDAQTRDRIGIGEGKTLKVQVEERDAPRDVKDGKVLWITGGELIEP